MEERWRIEGPRVVVLPGEGKGRGRTMPVRGGGAGDGVKEVRWDEGEAAGVRQVFGEAMSDYAGSDAGSGSERSPVRASAHARRRSFSPEPDDVPLAHPPSLAHHLPTNSHSTTHTFRNPFASTPSTHHASNPSHSSSTSSSHWTTSDSHPSSSAAHAHIHHAHSVAVRRPDPRPRVAVPVRTSSKREVHETVRAGPEGEGVVRTGSMLERRPTLTEVGGGDSGRTSGKGASSGTGATRGRHESVAGLIEVVADESLDDVRDDGQREQQRRRHYHHQQRRRTGSATVADPEPGEEDRPAFFQQRETVPRYDASRGDPRLPSRSLRGG